MANLARVVSSLTGQTGLPGNSVHYFQVASTTPTTAECTDIAGRVRAFWNGLLTYLAAGVRVQVSSTCDTFDSLSGLLVGSNTGTTPAVVVASGTDTLPPATQAGLKMKTAQPLNNRLLQGRTFIGPLGTNSMTSTGNPTAALITAIGASGALMATGATSALHVVWHRPSPTGQGGLASAVTAYTGATKMWVLRSRRD